MPFLNVPTYKEYKIKADRTYLDAFYEISSIDLELLDLDTTIIIVERKLEKAISMLQQSCEFYLKYLICKESPYLLLKIKDFPKKDKDFSDFYSVDAIELPKMVKFLYGEEIFKNSYNVKFEDLYKKNREYRNKFIHSVGKSEVDIHELILSFVTVFSIFNNNKSFVKFIYKDLIKEELLASEVAGLYVKINEIYKSKSVIRSKLIKCLSFFYDNLEHSERTELFKIRKNYKNNDNKYLCPKCESFLRVSKIFCDNKYDITCCPEYNIYDEKHFKSFIPIEKNSKILKCIFCGYKSKISNRKECACCSEHLLHKTETLFSNRNCLKCGCNDF